MAVVMLVMYVFPLWGLFFKEGERELPPPPTPVTMSWLRAAPAKVWVGVLRACASPPPRFAVTVLSPHPTAAVTGDVSVSFHFKPDPLHKNAEQPSPGSLQSAAVLFKSDEIK